MTMAETKRRELCGLVGRVETMTLLDDGSVRLGIYADHQSADFTVGHALADALKLGQAVRIVLEVEAP